MILKVLREGLGRVIILLDFLTRPKKMQRSEFGQQHVVQAVERFSLYQFYACPFCVKTRRTIHRLNLPIAVRNSQQGSAHRDELAAGGGKIKVPCLRIDQNDTTTWLYESKEIIRYLEKRFGQESTPIK